MSYFVVFAVVWWKLDFAWAVAACVALHIVAPWPPSHTSTKEKS